MDIGTPRHTPSYTFASEMVKLECPFVAVRCPRQNLTSDQEHTISPAMHPYTKDKHESSTCGVNTATPLTSPLLRGGHPLSRQAIGTDVGTRLSVRDNAVPDCNTALL